MEKLFYDFHMHSCLSPCGDDDMTPNNMIGMAKLKELDVVALTDHNSSRNCPAFLKVAEQNGLLAIPGMELCTSEEIHVVCLFYNLSDALAFDEYVYSKTPDIKNDTTAYGNQFIMDSMDNITGKEEKLLITAADISLWQVPKLIEEYHGIAIPAHIDKSAYSILSVLGMFPEDVSFKTAEIFKPQLTDSLIEKHPVLKDMNIIHDSDAHYLWDISERYNSIEVSEKSVKAILDKLKA
jgi:PHP family Zn ribbon phosphoesterase